MAYLGFLFVLPKALDVNKFIPDIKKIAQEQTGLNISLKDAKLITTPLLGLGIKANDISIALPDNSTLFSAESIKTRVSLPSLFVLTAKISCLEVNKPFVNLEILNNKEQNLEKIAPVEQKEGFKFNPAWIRIKIPCVKLVDYKILVNDLQSKHYLDLHGEELTFGYFNGKRIKLKTYAELFSDETKNITANINIDTCLPKPAPKLDEEDDKAERINIPFVNPVDMYRNYNLKANLDTKLKIKNHKNNISSYGHFNLENISMKVSHLQLPESYFRAKTFGKSITLDTNIYVMEDSQKWI